MGLWEEMLWRSSTVDRNEVFLLDIDSINVIELHSMDVEYNE